MPPTVLTSTIYGETVAATTHTQSVTIDALTTYLVVWVATAGPTRVAVSATWDSTGGAEAMTKVAALSQTTNQNNAIYFELVSPVTTGTATLSITLDGSGKIAVAVIPMSGVDLVTPRGTGTTNANVSDTTRTGITTLGADGITLGLLGKTTDGGLDLVAADGASQTRLGGQLFSGGSNNSQFMVASTKTVDGTMSFSWTNTDDCSIVVVPINVLVGGGGTGAGSASVGIRRRRRKSSIHR